MEQEYEIRCQNPGTDYWRELPIDGNEVSEGSARIRFIIRMASSDRLYKIDQLKMKGIMKRLVDEHYGWKLT